MIIDKKQLQNMQVLKIKHSLDEFPLEANYLFIKNHECIFISKFKNKLYQLVASPVVKKNFVSSQNYFNVLYSDDKLDNVIAAFNRQVKELVCPV